MHQVFVKFRRFRTFLARALLVRTFLVAPEQGLNAAGRVPTLLPQKGNSQW